MEYGTPRSKKLTDDTWVIYLGDTTAYLICGEERGIMIDSGDTPCALKEFCEEVCGKPVDAVANTHGHFDHTGGNGYFERAYMGRLAAEICRTPNGRQNAADFPMDYEVIIVKEGDKIDLGGRDLEVFMLDGHSPDSTAYLDKTKRLLFVGDNVGKAPLLFKCQDPQPSLLRYTMNVAKLMARRTDYDWVLRGHEDFMHDADIVNENLICCLRGLAGDYDEKPENRYQGGPKLGNPETQRYVKYNDMFIMFDERYAKDMTEYSIIRGT